ncbi:MAG: hypothetical protein P8Y40_08160 [Desulfobacterales bacterium]
MYFSLEEWYLPTFTSETDWLVNRIPCFERTHICANGKVISGLRRQLSTAVPLEGKTLGEAGFPCDGFPADRRCIGKAVRQSGTAAMNSRAVSF